MFDYALALVKLVQNREVGWQTLNRKTGKYEREQQPILKKLKLLLLFKPLTEWIDQTYLLRRWIHEKTVIAGQKEATTLSSNQIQAFIDFYHINMEESEPPAPSAYATFDDFFVRHHAPQSCPIYEKDNMAKAVVVADSRVVVYPSVSQTKTVWIKGKNFTIENLILDPKRASVWTDVSGDYNQVDPICLSSQVDILTRNAQCCIWIETREFGWIHALFRKAGTEVNRGDETGIFQFGGSSIIVAFEKDRIKFDEDLSWFTVAWN
ncbi:hypothetical protein B0J14DRAFT_629427, partial [Halenospora varia]